MSAPERARKGGFIEGVTATNLGGTGCCGGSDTSGDGCCGEPAAAGSSGASGCCGESATADEHTSSSGRCC